MQAFLYTGQTDYAHKAGVLLARISDVYPDMDWSYWSGHGFFNSDGLSGRGKIYCRIWEPGLRESVRQLPDGLSKRRTNGDCDPSSMGAVPCKVLYIRRATSEGITCL